MNDSPVRKRKAEISARSPQRPFRSGAFTAVKLIKHGQDDGLGRSSEVKRRGAVRGDPGVQLEVYLFFHKSTDCLNSDLSLSDDSAPVRQHWVQTCICYRSTLAPQRNSFGICSGPTSGAQPRKHGLPSHCC
ncbi:unnamed protein product [Leuciscus chuanchicus]